MNKGLPKICFVIPAHWQAIMGGSQYQAKFLVERLAALGCEVHYLTKRAGTQTQSDHQVTQLKGLRYSLLFDSVHLFKTLKRIRPNIIYQRVGCAYTGVCAFYAKRYGCKMVWHVASELDVNPMETLPRNPLHLVEKKLVEYGLRNARVIVAQSQKQSDLLQKNYEIRTQAVIPNFHPFPRETENKSKPVKILWIANLKPIKQPQWFIQLAKDLNEIGANFIIVGRPFLREQLQNEFIKSVSENSNLNYLGPRSNDEVNKLLATAHILVNTSKMEGFSNTFIQAWMRGVPVVSLNTHPDGVFDAERLGICADGNYSTMLDAVRRLAHDEPYRGQIAIRAKEEALANYGLGNLDRLVSLLGVSA